MSDDQSYDCPDGNCEDKCQELKDKLSRIFIPTGQVHKERNYCNKCPKKPPEITNTTTMVAAMTWESLVPFRKEVPVYRDHAGYEWFPDQGGFHDDPNVEDITFRDMEEIGYQCRYFVNEDGQWTLDDSSSLMGTYDYKDAPGIGHYDYDVRPHYHSSEYTPGLTTVY